jgi:sugar lactone lactonase YvrE
VAVPNVHTHELTIDARDNLFGEHVWYEGERIDKWGHYVWRRSPDGRVAMVIPRSVGFRRNYSFVRDGAGNMYWADGAQIRKRAPNGGLAVVIGGRKDVRWMHSTPAGTLYFVDGHDLVRVRSGKAITIVRNLADTTVLRPYVSMQHAIMGIWTDRAENVYVADQARGQIQRIAPNGRATTVFRSTFPWSPTGGAFARSGELWVLEWSATNQARVRKVMLALHRLPQEGWVANVS